MGRLSQVVNFRKINEAGKEFRRSDYWLLEITAPKGVYFPGNDLLQIRTDSFTTGINDGIQALSKQVRTFTIKQAGKMTDLSGQMSLTCLDRVDQTLSYFFDQWKQGAANRDELSGLPKELYISPSIVATYFDINEQPIRKLTFVNCFCTEASLPEDGSNTPDLEGEISATIEYEHFYRDFKNI